MADLDGDLRADLAFSSPQGLVNGVYRYRIDVRLAAERATTFDVDSWSSGGLRINARDVDGDDDLDLVITNQFGHEPVGVWINDGHGQFTQGRADAFAAGIWQETDRSWESPSAPHRFSASLVNPASAWVVHSGHGTALVLPEPLRVGADPHPANRFHLGNPLRAPPTA